MSTTAPSVSVVVPSFGRPELVARAVTSALNQTFDAIEVIVVVDGRDGATVEAIEKLDDERARTTLPPRRLGNGGARNAGVRAARGEWIALLDDDDEWLPGKLERQLEAAHRSSCTFPVVSCRLLARTAGHEFVWPRRIPEAGEALSDYLMTRKTPFSGEGIVQTSTILTRRELVERVPFRDDLSRYVDIDWLLRAAAVPGFGLEFATSSEPLSIYAIDEGRPRIGATDDWRHALAWLDECQSLVTPRAYAGFVLGYLGPSAVRAGERGACLTLLRQAHRKGRPRVADYVTLAAHIVLPERTKRAIAVGFERVRRR
jgi:glycosyltransferase involved in cell wall biosynthesis